MKSLALAAALSGSLALAGCNSPTGGLPATPPNATPIATVAGGNLARACAVIATAETYFSAVAFLVPPQYLTAERAAEAAVNQICSNTGQANAEAAMQKLDALWAEIQSLTTVPKK